MTGAPSPISKNGTNLACDEREWNLRVDLAAAFRLAAQFEWHESVGNHFSVVVGEDGKSFLLNPKWKHFSSVKASDLLLLNTDDPEVMQRDNAPDATAWCIHGGIHSRVPHARVMLHCHPTYATALCSLKDPSILPIDQNTAFFYKHVAIDLGYGGIADDWAEGERLAAALGNHSIMLMGNHGVLVTGESIAEAFEMLYLLERSCKTLVLAYSTGQPLNIMSDALAEKTASGWGDYNDMAFAHFDALKAMLDISDPAYKE